MVGVVAPGPGSRVRARTSARRVGGAGIASNDAGPAVPTVKLPSGDRDAVAAR